MDYELLLAQARSLTEEISDLTANLANLSALLFDSLEEVNWAGFYFLKGDRLVLSCFQGKPACVILPYGKGVCWRALLDGKSVNVPDVHTFAGHIACDAASASEAVIPLFKGEKAAGVLDIDSPVKNRFSGEDMRGLGRFAGFVQSLL